MNTVLASLPSMPLHTAGEYVAAAYTVAGLALIIYVGIMAKRLISNQREIQELRKLIEEREREPEPTTTSQTSVSAAAGDTTQEPVA
jgi:hypothetical protein